MKKILLTLSLLFAVSLSLFSQDFGSALLEIRPTTIIESEIDAVGNELSSSKTENVSNIVITLFESKKITVVIDDDVTIFNVLDAMEHDGAVMGKMTNQSGVFFAYVVGQADQGMVFILVGRGYAYTFIQEKKSGSAGNINRQI